jgi:hypothetical protein
LAESAVEVLNSGLGVLNKNGKVGNSLVKRFNRRRVLEFIVGLLSAEFGEELLDEVDNLLELRLVNFRWRSSKLSEDSENRLDERGGFVSKVLLEESNNVSETCLGLEESSGVNLEGVKELNGLFRSCNSFSVILGSSFETSVLVSEGLNSVDTVLFVSSEILVLTLKFILGISLFNLESFLFVFVSFLIVVGLVELVI